MRNILIVEDEPKMRQLLGDSLREAGYHVCEAADGANALEMVATTKSIALVVLDIHLPKISGMDMFEKIRNILPRAKIVIASVYHKDEQEFFIAGADDYYYKSDSIAVLINKVDNLFKTNE